MGFAWPTLGEGPGHVTGPGSDVEADAALGGADAFAKADHSHEEHGEAGPP